jgi:hypothetical protein
VGAVILVTKLSDVDKTDVFEYKFRPLNGAGRGPEMGGSSDFTMSVNKALVEAIIKMEAIKGHKPPDPKGEIIDNTEVLYVMYICWSFFQYCILSFLCT